MGGDLRTGMYVLNWTHFPSYPHSALPVMNHPSSIPVAKMSRSIWRKARRADDSRSNSSSGPRGSPFAIFSARRFFLSALALSSASFLTAYSR